MSFPPPVIPQTVEQARQRDQIAGLDPVPLDDPRAELERLRQAIRDHKAAVDGAGSLLLPPEHREKNLPVFKAKHEADRKLWSHIGERA